MNQHYDAKAVEQKWQARWEEKRTEKSAEGKKEDAREKYYVLDMFPYPSGDGLHVGHVENYTATDIFSRYKRLQGLNVLHPIGWDAFGLPAENFAIKTGVHPNEKTHQNIANFTRQIKSLGISYDWDREIDTSSPEYYRWTQWFFLFLYKNGLAYRKQASVNWCSSCQTVLANEQVVDGKCERCKTQVTQKDLKQWFFKITDFIEDREQDGRKVSGLLSGLEKVDWPESTKKAQKNWIGRSEGTVVKFAIRKSDDGLCEERSDAANPKLCAITTGIATPALREGRGRNDEFLEVFTTRVDTIFGCSYVVVAPEHDLVKKLLSCHSREGGNPVSTDSPDPKVPACQTSKKPENDNIIKIKNSSEVEKYIEDVKTKTELERTELAKEKTGVKLEGIEAINPFTGEALSVFVADYVLGNYGTGAVMAVPAHDERDLEFAKKYDLPVKISVESLAKEGNAECLSEDGILVNSGEFSELTSAEAREKMTAWLEEKNLGGKKVNYRLRDWLVSRQRYWGAPIPIIHCEKCGEVPVPEKDLPVLLPTDVDFRPTGESPLMRSQSFHQVNCSKCGAPARRESDTMDTFVCSSWYYLRFADPHNAKSFASAEALRKWLPVDMYMGGAEHTVLHLLYARFFTKALRAFGLTEFDEPFLKLRHQGMVLAQDGRKMSKSLGNVVNPDEVTEQFGADSLRLYEMFMGPIEESNAWKTDNIVGLRRFLDKVWRLRGKVSEEKQESGAVATVQKTIAKVTEDIENLRLNTAISALMVLTSELDKQVALTHDEYETLLLLLAPFAPHIAEELWETLGKSESIFASAWPQYDEKYVQDDRKEIVVQVNGKLRARLSIGANTSQEEVEKMAKENEKVAYFLNGKTVKKTVFVPGKLINIVVG